MTILRDPAATDAAGTGGAAPSTPQQTAATQATPAPGTSSAINPATGQPFNFNVNLYGQPNGGNQPAGEKGQEKPAEPVKVSISVDEYKYFQDLIRKQADELEKAEQARIRAIADKEGVARGLEEERKRWDAKIAADQQAWEARQQEIAVKAEDVRRQLEGKLSEADRRFADLQDRYYGTEKSRTVGDALAGVEFVSQAAAHQVRSILEPRFSVRPTEDGKLAILDSAGRPAAEIISEALASNDFAHFLKPSSRGGGGAPGGQQRPVPAGVPDAQARQLQSLKESVERNRGNAIGLTAVG